MILPVQKHHTMASTTATYHPTMVSTMAALQHQFEEGYVPVPGTYSVRYATNDSYHGDTIGDGGHETLSGAVNQFCREYGHRMLTVTVQAPSGQCLRACLHAV